MLFDYKVWNEGIEYGIVRGSRRTVFIKTGLGTDEIEPDSKYMTIARRLHEADGCGVVVAANPHDGSSHAESDRRMLERYLEENGISAPELSFFGNSNGCIKGLELAACSVTFQKMILVNMPLMINFHKTKGYIAAIPQTEILAVYGELDPSFSYVPFLRGRYVNLRVMTVPGADHNFKGKTDKFIDICKYVWYNAD